MGAGFRFKKNKLLDCGANPQPSVRHVRVGRLGSHQPRWGPAAAGLLADDLPHTPHVRAPNQSNYLGAPL
jgi:hypothetical protein